MWVRDVSQRITSGIEIREKIRNKSEWKQLVPKYIYNYIIDNEIDKRIRGEC